MAQGLAEAGLEVLLDDRDQSAGEKFHDAKLWGIPVLVVVGPRAAAQNQVELERRRDGEKRAVEARRDPVLCAVRELLAQNG